MKPKILVIDDDAVILRLMHLILKNEYEVTAVTSVAKAWQHIANDMPNLITCDLMMPEETGLDFLSQRNEHPIVQFTPVIIISGAKELDIFRQASELGADLCLGKPIPYKLLKEKIVDLLQSPPRSRDLPSKNGAR